MVPLDEARNVVFVREAKNIGEERRTDLVRFLRQQLSTHLHKLIASASTIIISKWLTAKSSQQCWRENHQSVYASFDRK